MGWTIDDGRQRTLTETVDALEALGVDAETEARDLARGHYLQALTRRAPDVLRELATIEVTDRDALDAWGDRWRLAVPWALAWARETIRFSRSGRFWWPPNEDTGGALVPVLEGEAPRRRPRRRLRRSRPEDSNMTAQQLARAMPLVTPEHFEWLAAWQCGIDYHTIAREAGLVHQDETDIYGAPIVRERCKRLARLIGLPRRPAPRGRPRIR